MRGFLKKIGTSFAVLGAFAFVDAAYGADATGRAAYDVRGLNRSGSAQVSSQRMPTMPTLPGVSVGNTSPSVPSGGNDNNNNNVPDIPDEPDNPPVETDCPDGGVANSDYTVENCMNDVLSCVNNGALPGGLNDLFNEDLRNAIVNGMGLCSVQVDRCVSTVRKDCRNVYRSAADVWIDFNTRKIQPEYYSFVLRKTGLTPNQAENTCLLLDKNTYGSSFNAVSNSGVVTAEYNNVVGAYNSQAGNILVKNQPQGVQVNDGNSGVDGQRGHYARWDPTTAECWIRVAAYNKDEQIKNSWLFGAAGDDQLAEVWEAAGDTFTCNRDLFGFALMNKTSTAAVVGIGGGTLVGAGIGALAGHGDRLFDCKNEKHREMLTEELRKNAGINIINESLNTNIPLTVDNITEAQCNKILQLYDEYNIISSTVKSGDVFCVVSDDFGVEIKIPDNANTSLEDVASVVEQVCSAEGNDNPVAVDPNKLKIVFTEDVTDLILNGEQANIGRNIGIGAGIGAGAGGLATAITAFVERSNISCRVGDGLDQVGFGKSYSIGTLKDFYVKWNLRLPDTISPTATVTDCASWKQTCATLTDLNQCNAAQINYKPAGAATVTLIPAACTASGSACIENYPVAKSYGACE